MPAIPAPNAPFRVQHLLPDSYRPTMMLEWADGERTHETVSPRMAAFLSELAVERINGRAEADPQQMSDVADEVARLMRGI